MSAAALKAGGVDQRRGPNLGIGIGGLPSLSAPGGFAGVGLLVFLPLIHLDGAFEAKRLSGNAKIGIGDCFPRFRLTAGVHQPSFVFGIHPVGWDGNHRPGALLEGPVTLDGPAFIPENRDESHNKEDDSENNPLQG